ncbi:HFL324Wp [Eremothecium sinecaudum]|uniref:HFL324Wp n=1 Tax=Eremothecium sinecaudum TaxID=45286 RepID=A0A0X8HU28_9SACH|nr:HFL324Wp [Eremothecium sinecaudum]AMD21532.1 HFL324Wp [Eremothecium sinecaudum]
MSRDSEQPPLKVHVIEEPPVTTEPEPFFHCSEGGGNIPIAIDFGSYEVRAGYVNEALPVLVYPNRLARYRDRKASKTYTFVGNDTNLDQSIRTQSKSPFDGSMITNWDYVEDMLGYTFNHLGVKGQGGVNNPVLITERMAALQSQRSNWYELLFECYAVPKVTFGIDSLFSFFGEQQRPDSTGLVISSGNGDTNVIPVVCGKAALTEAKRINWGGRQSVDYLSGLLSLKYPYFPTKLATSQFETMYHSFSYVATDFATELEDMLTLEKLEKEDIVVEAPFTEIVTVQKTEEELQLQAEKRRETGKRLQEQAKQRRKEMLQQKEEEYEYYLQIRAQLQDQPKKNILSTLQNAGFDDEDDFQKYITSLERTLKRARILDADDNDEDEKAEPTFDLLNIPDEELSEEQKREKRKQRLMKANYDARMKAKEEKLEQQKKEEEARLKDEQWRKDDLQGWIKNKRLRLSQLMKTRKEKLKMKDDMKDRKSQAAQKRMKNIASLAEDSISSNKRSRQQATIDNDPNDTFGANDDDWMIYNDISQSPEALDEAIEEEYKIIVEIEKELLEHDPNFTEEDTLEAQYDWRNSILHLFLRGPRPHDSENVHEQYQLHLNVERIRVPEVIFQPSIGGLDQAGIVELSETCLLRKFGSSRSQLSEISSNMAKNVFITGGNARLPGIRERIVREFTGFLPVGTDLNVRLAEDPSLSAWKGMAKFANTELYESSIMTKKDFEEYGPEYIKEHNLGNAKYVE